MKIFVVGGAGYIGSICTELLLDEGHEAIVFDNLGKVIVAQWIRERHSSEATLLTAKKFKRRFPVLARTR